MPGMKACLLCACLVLPLCQCNTADPLHTTAAGAAAGAGAGYAISRMTGSDNGAGGALVGGVVGGAAGYMYGKNNQQKQQRYDDYDRDDYDDDDYEHNYKYKKNGNNKYKDKHWY